MKIGWRDGLWNNTELVITVGRPLCVPIINLPLHSTATFGITKSKYAAKFVSIQMKKRKKKSVHFELEFSIELSLLVSDKLQNKRIN